MTKWTRNKVAKSTREANKIRSIQIQQIVLNQVIYRWSNARNYQRLSVDFHNCQADTLSSGSTSLNDVCIASISRESSDLKVWIRSESENSVPSWASSISLDSQTEEATLEFMKRFVFELFEDSSSISLDVKSEFGNLAAVINIFETHKWFLLLSRLFLISWLD